MNTPRILSIIIPCFNEVVTIREVIERVKKAELPKGWEKEIIAIDDGSTDDTASILRSLPGLNRVISREKNGGKGVAVKDGLRAATGDFCLIQDADLELDPAQYKDLMAPIVRGEAEAVFGYRIMDADAPRASIVFYGGKLLSLLYNLLFAAKFRDIPCAYKLFPRRCVPTLLEAPNDNFVFDAVEMTHIIHRVCSVAQVPVTYRPRTTAEGKKVRVRHGLNCAIAIILLRVGLYRFPLDQEFQRIARFLVTGFASLAVNLGMLYALTEWVHSWYLSASAIAFVGSNVVNFLLHKFWTFRDPDIRKILYQLPLHFGLCFINVAINTAIVYGLVEYFGAGYLVAQIAATAVIAAMDFLIFAKFIFRDK